MPVGLSSDATSIGLNAKLIEGRISAESHQCTVHIELGDQLNG